MGTLAQELGHTTKTTINGKEWILTRSTWDIQGKWGQWLADRAEVAAHRTARAYRKEAEPLQRELDALRTRADTQVLTDADRAQINARGKELIRDISGFEQASTDAVQKFQDRLAAGEFEFHSATVGQMAQMNLPGQFQLVWLCLQPNHPGITLEEVVKAHMPSNGPNNFIHEWRQALLKSEGVLEKNEEPPTDGATTPTKENPGTAAAA